MKILQVISHYVPAYGFGGTLQVAHQQSRELLKLGHAVTVCTTNLETDATNLPVPVDKPVDVDGVTVFYGDVPRFRRWGFSPRMAKRVWCEVAKADVVLLHGNYQFSRWIGALIARLHRKPYLIFAHSSLRRRALQSSSKWRKLGYLLALEHGNFLNADAIVFNVEEEQQDSLYCERGLIIPNGITAAEFDTMPARGAYRARHPEIGSRLMFTFLGRVDIAQKAVDRLVRAFALYCRQYDDAVLILAGPSESNDGVIVEKLVAELGLTNRVLMPGLVVGEAKKELLRDSDVFVLPSHYEGLSIALLEAMYVGLPAIVTTGVGLHTRIAQAGCGLVVDGEEGKLAEAMAQARSAEWRAAAGTSARRVIMESHLWPDIARQIHDSVIKRLKVAVV